MCCACFAIGITQGIPDNAFKAKALPIYRAGYFRRDAIRVVVHQNTPHVVVVVVVTDRFAAVNFLFKTGYLPMAFPAQTLWKFTIAATKSTTTRIESTPIRFQRLRQGWQYRYEELEHCTC